MNEAEYRVLTSFGGGSWYDLNHSMRVAKHFKKDLTKEEFIRILKKQVAYGYVRAKKDGVALVSYKNELGITKKGSDALEYWKRVRYERTSRKRLLSREGQDGITWHK